MEFGALGLRNDAQTALDYVTRDERLSKLPIVRPRVSYAASLSRRRSRNRRHKP